MFAVNLKKSCEKALDSDLFELCVVNKDTGELRLLTKNGLNQQFEELLSHASNFNLVLSYDSFGGMVGYCGEQEVDTFCCEIILKNTGAGNLFPVSCKISSDELNADDAMDCFGGLLSILDVSCNPDVAYS